MKKVITIMMAVIMILSMSINVFAATGTDGTITITNTTIGETYSVYKIFDATYNNNNAVTYTISATDKFFSALFGSDGNAANDFFEYHASTGVVTRKDGKTDAELFKYLTQRVPTEATASLRAEESTITFSGLTHGYYLITRTEGTPNGVTITNVTPDAEVHDKNHLPGGDISKNIIEAGVEMTSTTVNVGDTINWKVAFTATNYDNGEKVQYYTIKDTLSPTDWASIDLNSIKVKVGGEEKTRDTDWKLVEGNNNQFKIEIFWMDSENFKYDDIATVTVEVTYSATVLHPAAANDPANQENKNTVLLEWMTADGKIHDVKEVMTTTEVYNMGFTKVDGTDSTKTLPGAVFSLYRNKNESSVDTPVYVTATQNEGVYIVCTSATQNAVTQVQTPNNGQVIIMGLDAGTYYLKEITPPAGYNQLTEIQEVIVGGSNSDTMTVNNTTYVVNHAKLTIENFSGIELPSTGGEGTAMLITIGSIIAMAFAILLITHKKMSVYQD